MRTKGAEKKKPSQTISIFLYNNGTHLSSMYYLGHEIWDVQFRTWNLGRGIWDMKFGTWNLGYGIWDSRAETVHMRSHLIVIVRLDC